MRGEKRDSLLPESVFPVVPNTRVIGGHIIHILRVMYSYNSTLSLVLLGDNVNPLPSVLSSAIFIPFE